MTDDLVDHELSAALKGRAASARPPAPRFEDVERRADRLRRRRSSSRAAGGLAVVVVLAVAVLAVGLRPPAGQELNVATAPTTGSAPAAPTVTEGPHWAVLPGTEPMRSSGPSVTVTGVQPHTPGMSDVEIAPFLSFPGAEGEEILYALTSDRWTATTSAFSNPAGAESEGDTLVLHGVAFDAARFTVVPSLTPDFTQPMQELPRPEQRIAGPGSHPLAATVERHGAFDWVVLPPRCEAGTCSATAIGGDAQRLITVGIFAPQPVDLRDQLARIELRPVHLLPQAPVDNTMIASSYIRINLPIPRNDTVWPADVPTDYCTAYRQWKQIQMDELGSFGTPGWSRWADAIAAIAPPDMADQFRLIATEARAGHDVSTTKPGQDALWDVVSRSDALCP